MSLGLAASVRPSVHGKIKLARLLEMPEKDFEAKVRELEGRELFRRLIALGVVRLEPFPRAAFAARRFAGRELRASAGGLPELLDGRGGLAGIIERVGQERFEDCFLREEGLTDEQRARRCGISESDARRLREFVDHLYVQAEFESPGPAAISPETLSAVAGIAVDGGCPVLGFFNREIWKGRYRVDEAKREQLLGSLPGPEARRAERLLGELEFLDRRKSTLYRILEHVIEAQAEFFISRDSGRRRPLIQRDVAARLGVGASVLSRLIANKAVELPWGLEAPLRALFPSSKSLMRDRLYDLALERPGLSDEGLRRELGRQGVWLSRRSVAQYRKEAGLGARGRRLSERA